MIRCRPKGICSWDFFLEGEGHRGSLEFNWLNERGTVVADGTAFEVSKQGALSGHWMLTRAGQEVASAQKSTAFTRTFEIQSPMESLVLRAQSAFGRSFRVERSGVGIATMAPDHPFTRRASIETRAPEYHFPTMSFAFWLAVLTWRRAAASSS